MNTVASLLSVVDAYRVAREVSDARVSTLVLNDGSRITEIRSGKDIGSRRLDRALQWFSDNWPEGAIWPDDVMRPEKSEVAA